MNRDHPATLSQLQMPLFELSHIDLGLAVTPDCETLRKTLRTNQREMIYPRGQRKTKYNQVQVKNECLKQVIVNSNCKWITFTDPFLFFLILSSKEVRKQSMPWIAPKIKSQHVRNQKCTMNLLPASSWRFAINWDAKMEEDCYPGWHPVQLIKHQSPITCHK